MTRLRQGFGGQARFFIGVFFVLLLSGCGDTMSAVSEQVQGALSGVVAPVTDAMHEVSRRANEVGEGINQVQGGIGRVRGALSGSGSTW